MHWYVSMHFIVYDVFYPHNMLSIIVA